MKACRGQILFHKLISDGMKRAKQIMVIPHVSAQHSVHPTGGSRRVFKPFVWLEVGSVKMALSRPAHPRVTHTVGLPKQNYLLSVVKQSLRLSVFNVQT